MKPYLRIPLVFFTILTAVVLTIAALVIGGYYYVDPSLPRAEQLRDVRLQIPLRVYSRDGRLIEQFGEQNRTPVPYEDIPPLLVKAVLAAEDDRFFEHPGLDYAGTTRAVFNFLSTGGSRVPGGSTITQQVARAHFLTRDVTLVRKFKEWILAFRIEREFTKEEILELFLNTTFFGQSSYGVIAAAQTYFGKPLDELTVSEFAIIAGIPQGPSIRNPVASPENAKARRGYVLRRMRELDMISEPVYRAALAEPIESKRHGPQTQLDAPYVAEMVRAEMIRRFGPAAYTAGLKVTTTIDSRLQRAANRAIRATLIAYDERHGYRGPLARVEIAGDALPELGEPEADDVPWREWLDDYPDVFGFETAVVLGVDDASAQVLFRNRGRQEIGLESVAWAARYVNEDVRGPRPQSVADVLRVGDVVRFRVDADGRLRLGELPDVQGALVSVDPQDVAVAALTGGFDYFLSKYNRATQAKRQPGSAFKPFLYSAALERGFTTASIVNDAPLDFGLDPVLEKVWRPENYENRFHGETRLREALVQSMNWASIRVLNDVGIPAAVRHMRLFGFGGDALPPNLTLALGTGGVTPLELAGGIATFANGGYRVTQYFIDRIEDADGEVLYQAMPSFACPACDAEPAEAAPTPAEPPQLVDDATDLYPPLRRAERAISAQNAYLVTDMMHDVIRSPRGTGKAALVLGRDDLAGKTGTTDDRRDAWFAGFNGDIVATAWVGFDQDRPLGGNEQGGVTAIPMWIAFMADALEGRPRNAMQMPPGIVEVRINPENGLAASDATRNSVFEKFRIDHVPEREADPFSPGQQVQFGAPDRDRGAERIFQ